ncbi:MAG: DUF4129 domain-containing protein [Caulobacteraceae bacterium]|nr:MAG: DUF4129 domain-containing protein [Caulobacteraceae bacterium]
MGQPTNSVPSVPTDGPVDPSAFDRAHAALMADKTLQHVLPGLPEAAQRKPPPKWAIPLLDGLGVISGGVTFMVWTVIILGVALVIFLIVRELFGVQLGWKGGKAKTRTGATDWRPDREKARILLLDADALAGEGRFDEAVHMLLLRGVADITARRPRLIGPALTSRDIAALPDLPEAARPAFALIADIVERSFFGGRPVDEAGWQEARAAYEQLVFSGTWS